jgi:hypothetical protein
MENTYKLKKISNLDVYFRNPNAPLYTSNQAKELEKAIKFLTDEDFEDYKDGKYKRRLKHPENFEVIDKYPKNCDIDSDDEENTETYTCLCSEDTCKYLMIVKHIPTEIYIALGSICYLRFNEENGAEIYYHCKAKKCNDCKNPLVFKVCKFTKNTDKKCDGCCYGCIKKKKEEEVKMLIENKRVYLKVCYDDKDDAKSLGAWWDAEKKKWYAPNNSTRYTALIGKYS